MKEFADFIKGYRLKNDLTLDELSKIIGLPAQTINRYELGQRIPKLDVALKITDALNVNILEAIGRTITKWNERMVENELFR